MQTQEKEQIVSAVMVIKAVAETIRELGRVPAMGRGCTIQQFERIVQTVVGAGIVRKEGNELVWCGPTMEEVR